MHTPESVGSMMFGGRPRGDSGYAFEEEMLGGRLKHRHLVKHGLFVVSCLFLLLLEIILDYYASQLIGTEACSRPDPHFADVVQVQQLILMVGETSAEQGKELWYEHRSVTEQLERLRRGQCCMLS